MSRNYCEGEGAVGPADRPIPEEPSTFQYPGVGAPVLCSNLRCARCGQAVRTLDHATWEGDPAELPAAHARSELAGAPGVMPSSLGVRLYLCACDWLDCLLVQGLFLRGELLESGLPEGWACGGHPPVELPLLLDGVALPARPDWETLVQEVFASPVAERTRWARWIKHAFGTLAGTPHQAALDEAVGRRLFSADPLERSRAIRFAWGDVGAPSAELLVPLVLDHHEELAAVEDPLSEEGAPLYDTALRALAFHLRRGLWPYEGELRAHLRSAAARPEGLSAVLPALAELDRSWLEEHAEALGKSSPGAARALARKLAAG